MKAEPPLETARFLCRIVDGAAQLEGFGSGSPTSEDQYTSGCCHFFEGRALLVLRKTEETAPQAAGQKEAQASSPLAAGQKESQKVSPLAAGQKETQTAAPLTIWVEETGEGGILGELSLGEWYTEKKLMEVQQKWGKQKR